MYILQEDMQMTYWPLPHYLITCVSGRAGILQLVKTFTSLHEMY